MGAAVNQGLSAGDAAVKDIDIHIVDSALQIGVVVAELDHAGDVRVSGVVDIILLLGQELAAGNGAEERHCEQNPHIPDQLVIFHPLRPPT